VDRDSNCEAQAGEEVILSIHDWPKYPQVYVPISDLIDDPRNLPKLIKRCCVRAQYHVPWHKLIEFNMEVLEQPDWTLQWCVAVHWFDTVGEYVQKRGLSPLMAKEGF
jgi:hypothetical protein